MDEARVPLHWSATHELAWRIQLEGSGQSSPIISKGRVILTSALGRRKETLAVEAFALDSGERVWRTTAESTVPEAVSDMRSLSAPTPVAVGDSIYALFESGDVLALDSEGRLQWHVRLPPLVGELSSNHGLGGSPIVAGNLLVLPLDQDKPSSLVALDRERGELRWRAERPGRTAWSTPVVARGRDGLEVILSGGGTLAAYQAESGRPLWEISGFVRNLVPSATLHGGLLVVGAGSKGSNRAYRWKGGAEPPEELWRAADATTGFASPLVHRGRVYFLSTAGVLNCLDAESGKEHFAERVVESAWASPVGAGNRIYIFGQNGTTTVLECADEFRPLATNTLAFDSRVVGVAVANEGFVLRSYQELVRVGLPGGGPRDP